MHSRFTIPFDLCSGQNLTLPWSRHVSWSRIVNQLSGTRFEVSLTLTPKASHDCASQAISPPESTLTQYKSPHVAATPSIQRQIKMNFSQIAKTIKRPYPPTQSGLCNNLTTYQTVGDNDGNPPAHQSSLRFNSDSYRDQEIQTNQLRSISIRICSAAYVRYKHTFFSNEKVAYLILRAHTTPHW